MKNRKFDKYSIIFWIIIIFICITRFLTIKYVPDVFCDEKDILNHVSGILKNFKDFYGNYLPFYSKVGDGLATFTYMYPMAFFTFFTFGVSALKIRIIQQILTIFACYLTALSVKNFTKNREMFRICLIVSLCLPWGIVQANRIWDPAFVPLYFSIHLYLFSLYYCKSDSYKKITKNILLILSFVFLVILATVYPPCRIPSVAMWIYLMVLLFKKNKIGKLEFFMVVLFSFIASLPLAINLLNPEFNSRTLDLILFSPKYTLKYSCLKYAYNIVKMFNPIFLFFLGDSNYRHAVPIWGMLGFLSIIPLVKLFTKKISKLNIYMIYIIVFTNLSVALTNEGIPHSLRSCLAWLPFSILISSGWYNLLNSKCKEKKIFWQILNIFIFIVYIFVYCIYYSNMNLA